MKRLILNLLFLFGVVPLSVWAQNDDIEVTDSTSTDWNTGDGGGLNPQKPTGPVTSLTISQTAVTLEGGQTVRLVATVNNDAANKNVEWTSNNSVVASVNSKGLVRALTKGTATITATAAGNTSLKKTCVVTVTSDYTGLILPDVEFEFCYDAADYDAATHSIPNHEDANLASYALQLSANIPVVGSLGQLRITDRCEGYINRWEKESYESGSYFYRSGQDCMTIVAKVAPQLNTGNASDFVSNRGAGYNYMMRIGDHNSLFLHTGRAYEDSRTLPLASNQPQILAVRVNGPENYIMLHNLTTGESLQINGIEWGGGSNVFKLFYNSDGEFFRGDFYWVFYSFKYLSDDQLAVFSENLLAGDVNGDGEVNEVDAQLILDLSVGQISLSDLAVPAAVSVPGGNDDAYEVNAQIVLDYSVATVKPW